MKLALVLFNLGGPDSLEAVEPFLRNLFSDPAILTVPGLIRKPLSRWMAARRARVAREIYAKIGGRSPILEETEAQARTLEKLLSAKGWATRAFIAMRCWKPFSDEAAAALADWRPDRIVLLPLYPQFSTTTTASALDDWQRASRQAGLTNPGLAICCYPKEPGFVAAEAALIGEALAKRRAGIDYRVLLSAHALPKRMVARGDPYPSQVGQSAAAIISALGCAGVDWQICFQSRVGPLAWIGPATDAEIRRAGREGRGLIVAPIAFVCEHSETLVELDIEYAKQARDCGVPDYIRVPTVGTHPEFMAGLARMVLHALNEGNVDGEKVCPSEFACCGYFGGKR